LLWIVPRKELVIESKDSQKRTRNGTVTKSLSALFGSNPITTRNVSHPDAFSQTTYAITDFQTNGTGRPA
jgi:hypothetical protein